MMSISSSAGSTAPVGRERELLLLRHALAAARSGDGRLALVCGEAGIGKSTLVAAFAREAAAQGALVFTGGSYDLTTTPPYGPWNEIARQWAARGASPEAAESSQPRADLTMAEIGSKRELLAIIASLCTASAGRTHLLLLEDIHWADAASLELLQIVVRAIAHERVLLVVTYRDDEVTRQHPLFTLLPVLARTPGAERLTLAPLEPAGMRQLVAERYSLPTADVERLLDFVQARTDGNPLFVGEMLRAIEETGALGRGDDGQWLLGDLTLTRTPPLVRQVIESRLTRLGSEARAALEVAAVIGRDVPVEVWIASSGQDERVLTQAMERAVEAHVVDELPRGAGFRFTHELVRETLYYGVGLLRRRRWHRRVGEALAALPRPDPDAVAHHFQRSGDERAFEWLLRAAERAERAWAWVAATDRLEAALALAGEDALPASERGWLLYRLAMLLRLTDPPRALGLLEQTLRLALDADDALLTAHGRYNHGRLKLYINSWASALDEMAEGVALLAALPPLDPGGHTLFDIVDAHTARGTYTSWLAQAGRFAELRQMADDYSAETPADAPPTAADGDVCAALAIADAFQGLPDSAIQRFRQAVEQYWEAKDLGTSGCNYGWMLELTVVPYLSDNVRLRSQLAEDFAQVWSELASLTGHPDVASVAHLTVMWLDGRWTDANDRALRLNASNLAMNSQSLIVPIIVNIGIARGDYALVLEQIRRDLPAGPTTLLRSPLLLVRQRQAVQVALDAGKLALARDWLEAHDHWQREFDTTLGRAEGALLWSRWQQAHGDLPSAREHAELAVALAREPRQPLTLLAALRQLGELDCVMRNHPTAASHLDESLRLADDCAVPYERALTLLAQAELLYAGRSAHAAREAASQAQAIFVVLEAAPALLRVERLLEQLSEAPGARRPAGLTTREVDVLRLVTQGLTDAEVAEQLYVARRTVNTHLTSIYTKLGVSSRAGATRFAVEHGLA
jgi:DNA-binding NarL/FixJ family response regulator